MRQNERMSDHSTPPLSLTVRHEPVQARAAHRVETLLDAAAAVVVEHGIEHLTTALVAERAGASIGTVYRYFPDRVAVLVALAERNLERLRFAIARELGAGHATWSDTMQGLIDAMIETFRSVPSFRMLRAGEGLDLGPEHRDAVAPLFVDDLLGYLHERWGLEAGSEQRERLELAIGGLDALVTYAFLHDPDGDPRYLSMGMQLARERLDGLVAEG